MSTNCGSSKEDIVVATHTHNVCILILISAEPLILTHRTLGVRSNPVKEPLLYAHKIRGPELYLVLRKKTLVNSPGHP